MLNRRRSINTNIDYMKHILYSYCFMRNSTISFSWVDHFFSLHCICWLQLAEVHKCVHVFTAIISQHVQKVILSPWRGGRMLIAVKAEGFTSKPLEFSREGN